jgi:hypothetical protein
VISEIRWRKVDKRSPKEREQKETKGIMGFERSDYFKRKPMLKYFSHVFTNPTSTGFLFHPWRVGRRKSLKTAFSDQRTPPDLHFFP